MYFANTWWHLVARLCTIHLINTRHSKWDCDEDSTTMIHLLVMSLCRERIWLLIKWYYITRLLKTYFIEEHQQSKCTCMPINNFSLLVCRLASLLGISQKYGILWHFSFDELLRLVSLCLWKSSFVFWNSRYLLNNKFFLISSFGGPWGVSLVGLF